MTPREPMDALARRIADGDGIDWSAVTADTISAEDSALVEELRILEKLGAVHRSDFEPERAEAAAASAAEPAPTPDVRQWGRYRLIRQLGEGSYGAVFLAHDAELDRQVAIKLLHQLATPADRGRKIREEGQALARIRHANVVTVYDVEAHAGQLGLCMEYIEGRTLEDRVRRDGPLSADEATAIGQYVCRALSAVHAAGLVHRDVKARNVMRERAGRIVLMDLGAGTALSTGAARAASTAAGTPLYMAPELFEGRPASVAADVYATGVLLYFLATGEYPVWGDSVADIVNGHKQGRRLALEAHRLDLPDAFVRVVDRAISPDPKDRHASALELLRDLGGASTSGSHRLRPLVDDVPPPARTWRDTAATMAKAVLGVIALAVVSGHLTAWTFNAAMARPWAFDSDRFGDRVLLGFSSFAWPAVSMLLALAVLVAVQLVGKLLRPLARWLRGRPSERRRLFEIPESQRAAFFGQVFVLVGIVAILFVIFVFGDILVAFVSSVSTADLDRFAPLRDENRVGRLVYRMVTASLVLALVLAWEIVRRVRLKTNSTVPAWQSGVGILLAALLFGLSQAPYKSMVRNTLPVVSIDRQRCFLLGEHDGEARIFCPASPTPRVRSVRTAQTTIVPCGFEENVFEGVRAPGCEK